MALTRKYGQQWEAVLMGVAAACALFVVGVAVNSFRPHPGALEHGHSTPVQPTSISGDPSLSSAPLRLAPARAQGHNSGVTIQGGKPGVTLLPEPTKGSASQPGTTQVANSKPSSP